MSERAFLEDKLKRIRAIANRTVPAPTASLMEIVAIVDEPAPAGVHWCASCGDVTHPMVGCYRCDCS